MVFPTGRGRTLTWRLACGSDASEPGRGCDFRPAGWPQGAVRGIGACHHSLVLVQVCGRAFGEDAAQLGRVEPGRAAGIDDADALGHQVACAAARRSVAGSGAHAGARVRSRPTTSRSLTRSAPSTSSRSSSRSRASIAGTGRRLRPAFPARPGATARAITSAAASNPVSSSTSTKYQRSSSNWCLGHARDQRWCPGPGRAAAPSRGCPRRTTRRRGSRHCCARS